MGSNRSRPKCDCDKSQDIKTFSSGEVSLHKNNAEYFIISDKIEDPQKPLKNVATDFVVDYFFNQEASLYLFLQLIILLYNDALANYRNTKKLQTHELFFLYKGGNIMRIVAKEFLLDFPENATREISKFYSPFFKRSDADFSVYLAPWVNDYDNIYNEITDLTYQVQLELRTKFQNNPEKYFDFTKYSEQYKKVLLTDLLVKFNEVDPKIKYSNVILGNASINSIDKYKTNDDLKIEFADHKPDDYIGDRKGKRISIGKNNSYLYITHNTSLDFSSGTEERWRSKFNLIRTKIGFNLRKGSSIIFVGGELIDVSIPHRKDTALGLFYENINNYLESYEIVHERCNFEFNSYSVLYLTKDLEKILFKQNLFPWEDEKYGKRLNRVFYFYFVDIFMKIKNGEDRCQIISDMRDLVIIPMIDKINIGNEFILKYGEMNLAMSEIIPLLQNMLKFITDSNVGELEKMYETIIININFILKTIKNIRHYCSEGGGIIEEEDIYNITTKELI